jgi:Ni,Fe-hydrogenase III small subunit/ferredoxin
MWRALHVRGSQGSQAIADLRAARPVGLRGRPTIASVPCSEGCTRCVDVCPTQAITLDPVRLDLGRCTFCHACAEVCPSEKFAFSPDPRMASVDRAGLVVTEGAPEQGTAADDTAADDTAARFRQLFGRSFRLRQVSAGGCNACEMELAATTNVNFDLQRYGIDFVASPRHADALVLTGPLTTAMARAVRLAWDAMPEPRFLVTVGACAISGGLYRESTELDRGFLDTVGPLVHVPGCPPHPLTFAHAMLDRLGR